MSEDIGQSNPITPDAVFARSMEAFQRRDFDAAIRFGDHLFEITQGAGPAIVWGVRLRLEARRWQEAVDLGSRGQEKSAGLCGLVGHALEALGRLDEAQVCFERAAREQPENPAWLMHNASALSRLYRDFESMEVLQKAMANSIPPDPGALLILAAQELAFGNASKALSTVERALRMNPKIKDGQPLAARCLMAMGRFDEAENRWSIAISLEPRDGNIPLQRAISLIRFGRFDQGTEALDGMLQKHPRFVPALVQIATAKRFTEEDVPLIHRMEEILTQSSLGDDDRIALRYALGKAYDNLKNYEQAMAHFDEANRIQYRTIEETGGFDREGYRANMALRMKVYSDQVVRDLAKHGNATDVPIFILGVIRSGTTLAEQIISSHPMVAGAGELDFWINSDLRLMDYSRECLNEKPLRDAAEVYLRLLAGFAKEGVTRVIDKQPGNLILAGALHIAFPNARIIHMHRHPVDTAVSIWTTHVRTSTRFVNHKGNMVYAFREHEKLLQHWRETIPPDRFMDVSYESLVTDRENLTRKMLKFCDLPWNEVCLAPEKNRKAVITPSLWQVRQPVYRTSIERWRNFEPWLGEFSQMLVP